MPLLLSKMEISLGVLFIGLSLIFHVNSFLCFIKPEQCGGLIGSMITFYAFLIGACLLVAGLSYQKGLIWFAMAHLPVVYSVYLLSAV